MRSVKKLGAALLAAGLLVAACGGDDDDASDAPEPTEADGDDAPATTEADGGDDGDDAPATTEAGDDGDGDAPATTDAGDDGDAGGGEVCTEDRKGGELTITSRGISRALDTAISNLASPQTGSEGLPFYSVLTYYDYDAQDYVPHLAESIEPNEDFTVWTVTLPEEAVFGNGDPLDAQAFIAHLDRHLGPESTSRIKFSALGVIQSYEAVSDHQVAITLNFAWTRFPSLLAADLGMIQNVAVIEERGEEFGTNPAGAGAGPYEIVEYAAPERIVFEAKDDWWGGPVCIERLTYTFIPDLRANYDAYQTGEIDGLLLARDPVLIKQAIEENDTLSVMYNTAFLTMPNLFENGPEHFKDIRVRQAMAYAIDPEVVNARAWGGEGWGTKGLIHEESITIEPTEGLPYDPDMAKQLLDEYKAETGWDGTIQGIAADTPQSNQEAALAIASMLDAVGFNVETSLLGINDLIAQVIIDRNYELVLSWGFINSEENLYSGLRTWEPTNPANQNGFQGEAYAAALVELREAESPEEYQAALEAVQAAVNEELPWIAYGGDLSTMVYDPAIKGGIPFQNGTLLFDHAYLEE